MNMCIPSINGLSTNLLAKCQGSRTEFVKKNLVSLALSAQAMLYHIISFIIILYLHEYYLWYMYFRTEVITLDL